ncbi:MAG: hypothetical protein WC364_10985 [Eubacteriales bacterium]|jgi:hypothetical protein
MLFSKASGLNDSVYGKSLYPIRKWMEERNEFWEARSKLADIFGMDDIDTWCAKYGGMTSLGDMEPVGEGAAYPRGSMQEGYSKVLEPYEWKLSSELTQAMVEDNLLLSKGKLHGGNMVKSYHRIREKFGAAIFNNITATTFDLGGRTWDNTCWDGGAIAATSHTSKVTGSALANSDNYDTVVFSYDNLCAAEEKMQKFTDEDGNLVGIQPDTIIIPNNAPIKKLVMDSVLTESGRPGTTDHSTNIHAGRWNVVIWDMLSKGTATNDPWYLVDSEYAKEMGLFFLDRTPLQVKQYVDENTDNLISKARARFIAGCADWRCLYASVPA